MPRYEYRCPACGTQFEVEHGMTEHPQVACPACGTEAERVFVPSGIAFKGSGFYNTDQRGSSSATPATSSAGSKCASCSGGSCGSCASA
ncbi:MAG: FmdB family transcriptional regulator [Atopobiaceae bacterium]|jgi:putative FmdB family regulatory protein|nr:FmdB family transcriptional regulator [Atopobiaceae bacterium]MCH4120464.1 FmdB family transcriptional regulator [Atopobiaceae bacterium]MCI1388302.1 FmdB family transcriptional regulator [Atopobiaceae bacterium]MCI1431448.1 FmdB family transcriptional regulator [Atopobiaceae bacterium]MCI1469884.1 FmdB family transcriptional regulator [Atopobiaceae bacterium]